MEGENDSNSSLRQMMDAAAAVALPVSEAVEVVVGLDDNLNYGGNDRDCGGVVFTGERKPQVVDAVTEPSAAPQKRGRGRPKGSGKWRTLLSSSGDTAMDSAEGKFTPHVITIQRGENIVQRISSVSQRASESFCILSASGSVSNAEILLPGSCGGILRYEGHFEIVSLTGSNSSSGMARMQGNTCLLSVLLANPDGDLFGGAVAGPLMAGGPTQIVMATFRLNLRKQLKVRHCTEPAKPNTEVVAVPLQKELPEAESNGPTIVSQAVEGMDEVMNHAFSQPFDWTSLQSSSSMSHVVISDVNNGIAD